MLSGLTHILSRIKHWLNCSIWWLTKSGTMREKCHGFCSNCAWYEYCAADEMGLIDEDEFDWYADADYDYPME